LDAVGIEVPDKLVHFAEYAILGLLFVRGAVTGSRGRARWVVVSWALLAGAALGAVDETYQSLIPGRHPSSADWAADLVGSLAGSGAVGSLAGSGAGLVFLDRKRRDDQQRSR
jgi:VanZ family protein